MKMKPVNNNIKRNQQYSRGSRRGFVTDKNIGSTVTDYGHGCGAGMHYNDDGECTRNQMVYHASGGRINKQMFEGGLVNKTIMTRNFCGIGMHYNDDGDCVIKERIRLIQRGGRVRRGRRALRRGERVRR